MFPYSDPTQTGLLERLGALEFWRQILHGEYVSSAREPNSAFTVLEAFDGLDPEPSIATVDWVAFPRTANAPNDEIDAVRILQDEYVEWNAEHDDDGKLMRVTFTTEFREWYAVLAAVSFEAVAEAITEVIPGADPSPRDLFGPNFDPALSNPSGRFRRFLANITANPWNNGERGILALSGSFNSIPALFALVAPCAVIRDDVNPPDVCALPNIACVPDRNSDPFICSQTQSVARGGNGLALADPAGIHMTRLRGQWRLDGRFIDIDDPEEGEESPWTMTRNGRRAVLDVTSGATLDNEPITSGAQVAARLQVGADVIFAPEADLPEFARTGNEFRVPG